MAITPGTGLYMWWRRIRPIGRCGAVVLAMVGFGATAQVPAQQLETVPAEVQTAGAQRLQVLERIELPRAREALQSHLKHCDTLMAVLHTRRAMAMMEGPESASSWQDMEVLVAQCQVTANQLRSALQALEAEKASLQQAQGAAAAP
ncbi:hypothetical protein ACSLNH_13030 [Comamonas kerstersii]|uniref:hypothetical protein n=1 Tax=Comamonas kerstersii TaxID=225992 RepID=UPI003EE2E807